MEGTLMVNGSVDTAGVTTFANEACEKTDILSNYVPSSLTITQTEFQDLKKYFERPRLISSGAIPFGSGGVIVQQAFDLAKFTASFPQWNQRLSGVYAIRFKMRFRLQVAATAFHQGLLAMAWQYDTLSTDAVSTNKFVYLRTADTAVMTNLPHVRLDLSEQTMVELDVPFLHQYEYFSVVTPLADQYGTLGIGAILPLISVSGLAAPSYKLYVSLTDMELYGADNNASSTITLQSGDIVSSEAKTTRLLSNTLSSTAKVGRFIGKHIPSLSSIAGTAAWAADTAAGVARYFGYSRPMIQDPLVRMFKSYYTSETNVDVPMAGFTLGLMQSNSLAVSPEVGASNVDEMSLKYITSQWSQLLRGYVSAGDTHGKAIYASPVSPSVMWFRWPSTAPYCNIKFPNNSSALSASTNSFIPTSIMNISSYFRMWRGGFKYRITFAKTKFHGGRYLISFNPKITNRGNNVSNFGGTVDGPEVVSGLVQPYGYSMIIDLKDGNVFEFDVPYIVEVPYVSFLSSIGSLSIVCMDPLQSSGSVSSTVPFLIEVCGADDYELADYAGNYFVPFPAGTVYTQSGEIERQSGQVVSSLKEPAPITIGEKIMSVKQMIQVPWWIKTTVAATSKKTATLSPWYTSISSYGLNASKATPMPANLAVPGAGCASAALAKLYLFARGGTDYHIYPVNAAESLVRICVEQSPLDGNSGLQATNDLATRSTYSATPKVISTGPNPVHVRLPAFQPKVRVPSHTWDLINFSTFGAAAGADIMTIRGHVDKATVINEATVSQLLWVSRAASDDSTLVHYMGPVPVYVPNSTSTANIDTDWYTDFYT